MTKQDKAIEQNMLKPAGLNPKVKYSIAALLLAALLGGIWWMEQTLPASSIIFTVLKKGAIYSLIAVSLNLLNGFTGLFSLGQAGFMLVGAYTYAIFTIPPESRAAVYMYYDGGIIDFAFCLFLYIFGH